MTDLDSRLDAVVGGRTAKVLAKALDAHTVTDLLRHYPRRMAERGELTDLGSLRVDEEVTVVADVLRSTVKGYGNSVRLEVVVGDDRGTLNLVFFGRRSIWRERQLQPGVRAMFAGKVGLFHRTRQLAHPDYQLLSGEELDPLEADMFARALIPVYPATAAVPSWVIARAVEHVLRLLDPLPDPLPEQVLARHRLTDLDTAVRGMHRPIDRRAWSAARRRLAFDEALAVQLVLAQRRARAAANPATPRPVTNGALLDAFDGRLPFRLTDGQHRIGSTLADELAREHPMHRLLQGEVGSGKTLVALRAMLQVVDAGGQAALLAPTEVLAAQHARTVDTLLGPLGQAGRLGAGDVSTTSTRVALLTGSQSAAARRDALLDAASGAAGIVIGTHALIQEQVSFADLGLVVVDEQHRFGVEQRDALRGKASRPPHLLVMTATPIPRTVAMTVFGDLDTSVLAELPLGRAPISTSVVPALERPAWLDRVWQRIREEVAAGRQAYVVCPRIGGEAGVDDDGEDDAAGADQPPDDSPEPDGARRPPAALVDVLAMLADGPLQGLRLAALHGRMPAEDKDRAMTDFTAGRVDVLVATTVVEVGVDVPNATVMVVLDADRFGVSQLHQLRGRIGRGAHPGLCLLITVAPAGSPARERLDAVAATTDGFELARLDVEQRREGDVLGVAQSGRRSQFRLLSLLRDEDLILAARTEATALVEADPDLSAHPRLAAEAAALAADERSDYLDKA
jgi:ATP-dependent DNA helicase RecG